MGRGRYLVLYSRPGCHLCDEARRILEDIVATDARLRLVEVDIESDDELHARHLERIPVVELDGEVISELVPDPQALREALLHTEAR